MTRVQALFPSTALLLFVGCATTTVRSVEMVPGSPATRREFTLSQDEAALVDQMDRETPGRGRSRTTGEELCAYWQRKVAETAPAMTGAVEYVQARRSMVCDALVVQAERHQAEEGHRFDNCLVTGTGVDEQVSCSYLVDGVPQMRYISNEEWARYHRTAKPSTSWGCHLDHWDKAAQHCLPEGPATTATTPGSDDSLAVKTSVEKTPVPTGPVAAPAARTSDDILTQVRADPRHHCMKVGSSSVSCTFVDPKGIPHVRMFQKDEWESLHKALGLDPRVDLVPARTPAN